MKNLPIKQLCSASEMITTCNLNSFLKDDPKSRNYHEKNPLAWKADKIELEKIEYDIKKLEDQLKSLQ